jgi:hypothetical protein
MIAILRKAIESNPVGAVIVYRKKGKARRKTRNPCLARQARGHSGFDAPQQGRAVQRRRQAPPRGGF